MWPMVRHGDIVRVAHGLAKLKRGDIVAYQCNGELTIHRLVRTTRGAGEPLFLMKGDNASVCDPAVRATNVLGRVVALRRAGKWRRLDTALMQAIGWTVGTFAYARFIVSRRLT